MNDPHLEWARQAAVLEAQLDGMPDADEIREPVLVRLDALRDKIGTTPARTTAGAREQVLLAIRCVENGSSLGPIEVNALRHAAATLERLAGEETADFGGTAGSPH